MQNATWPVSRLTCGFCGFVNPHLNTGAATWAPYYRAVYCTGDPDDVDPTTTLGTAASATIGSNRPQLSGVGYHQVNSAENSVPPLAHQRYNDPDLDPSTCVTIRDIRPPGPDVPPDERAGYAWGFLFHEACWALLEQALKPDDMNAAAGADAGNGNGNSTAVIEALWRVLQSVPCGTELPNWGHNYGGLYMGTVKDQCKGEHFVLMGPNSNLVIPSTYANPFRIPEVQKIVESFRIRLDDVIKESVAAAATATVGAGTPTAPSNETPPSIERSNGGVASPIGGTTKANGDPFARLPQELRELLLCYLATPDVANLRAASREIAGLPLSQPFFRSRFWPGRELHMRGTDWARLYRHLKTNLRYNKVGLGERNRLRIWAQTVRPLADAMRFWRWWDLDAPELMMDWKAVKTARCRAPEDFGELGRVLHRAEVELPANQPLRGIYVSLVPFFGARYISGLRFVFEHGGGGVAAADVELGYVLRGKKQQQHYADTGCEEYLAVNGETLVGFYAAIDECGFRALSLLTAKNTMSEYVDWVGELGALPAVAIKARGAGLRRVRAAFDGFRMQALFVPAVESG
ncbi:F-box domain-containing protein [Apiospora aurea]|uniref:F-box domain-containing protein n=1 Tax=Apiospora aurea TaxID=335848 RepID=A0ABR1QRW4_9PEZI